MPTYSPTDLQTALRIKGERYIGSQFVADARLLAKNVIDSADAAGQPTPSPTGAELALIEAKRHIALLTRLSPEDPLWQDAAECARAFIADAPTDGDIFADLLGHITDGRNEYRAALAKIAESRDAGRHDGLREECPLHDQYTMWLEAREALAKEGP